MRFKKAEDLLRLARAMQGTREGLSLGDIQRDYGGLSRRTAERMRDAVERVFPQMEEAVGGGDRLKRWRLPSGSMNNFLNVGVDELSAIDTAAKLLRRNNLKSKAEQLEQLSGKLRAIIRSDSLSRIDSDLIPIMEAEGLVMRPGPKPIISPEVLQGLRLAIKACRKIRLHYLGRGTGKLSRQVVCPYGLLYGGRHYLVAYSMEVKKFRLYSLSNIKTVEVLDGTFKSRKFSLQQYAARSFGVFQEAPVDVAWRFHPAAAAAAAEYEFHPTQTKEYLPDGSLLVKFRAGGILEMAWHLYTWGDAVEVLAPKDFWQRVKAGERSLRKSLKSKQTLREVA